MPTSMSIRLPDQTAKALQDLAVATDRPKTYFVLKALEAYLDEYADYQVALDRLMDERDPIVASTELRRRLGSAD